MPMAESKRTSRAAPAREAHAESSRAATPDETTGLSLLVAAGSLAAFILLGSAPPHEQGAIEVTEQAHGIAAEPAERSTESDAPARPGSDAPTVKLNELELEEAAAPESEGAVVEPSQPPPAAPEPSPEDVVVPQIVLEEEEPAAAAPPAPPAAPAVSTPKLAEPAAAPKAPVAAAPAPPPQPAMPSEPANPPTKPQAPAAPKAPSLPPAPTIAPPASNPY